MGALFSRRRRKRDEVVPLTPASRDTASKYAAESPGGTRNVSDIDFGRSFVDNSTPPDARQPGQTGRDAHSRSDPRGQWTPNRAQGNEFSGALSASESPPINHSLNATALASPINRSPTSGVFPFASPPSQGSTRSTTPGSHAGFGAGGGSRIGPAINVSPKFAFGDSSRASPLLQSSFEFEATLSAAAAGDAVPAQPDDDFEFKYQLGSLLGRGGHAAVFLAIDTNNGEMFAVKKIPIAGIDGVSEEELDAAKMEVNLMTRLRHPHIVWYYGAELTEQNFNIIMEYVPGGSIASILKRFGPMSELLVSKYVQQILQGLAYLHDNGVVHRDIKGANILVDNFGKAKLADFGASKALHLMQSSLRNSIKGTPQWMAPEVIRQEAATSKSDIWSLGCTIIEMFTAKPPFAHLDNQMVALFQIGMTDAVPPYPDELSGITKSFLDSCLCRDPTLRADAHELLMHPFVSARPRTPSLMERSTTPSPREAPAFDAIPQQPAVKLAENPVPMFLTRRVSERKQREAEAANASSSGGSARSAAAAAAPAGAGAPLPSVAVEQIGERGSAASAAMHVYDVPSSSSSSAAPHKQVSRGESSDMLPGSAVDFVASPTHGGAASGNRTPTSPVPTFTVRPPTADYRRRTPSFLAELASENSAPVALDRSTVSAPSVAVGGRYTPPPPQAPAILGAVGGSSSGNSSSSSNAGGAGARGPGARSPVRTPSRRPPERRS